jgi:hypothetical protein
MNEVQTRWWNKEYNILPNEGLPIELARGCIFKCKFCSYPLLGKKKGTYLRDPEEIRDELIKIYEAHGTTSYYFADDTFNDDNDKIEALHKVFTSLPFQPKFSAYLRIDLINRYPHQADLLSEMGLIGNYFGLETMHPDSAKAIGKGLSPNKVKDRLYWLQDKWKNKVNMAAGFILGLPYDNIQYFDELINWCMEKDNPIQNIAFYPLYMYPHLKKNLKEYASEFSLNPEIYGYEFDHPTTPNFWKLKDSPLSFELCREIARRFHNAVSPNNKISEFQMITALNTGIELQDLYTLTTSELYTKYDIISLNNSKILEYKKYKEAAVQMADLEALRMLMLKRGNIQKEMSLVGEEAAEGTELQTVTLFKLMKSFEKVMTRLQERQNRPVHTVVRYNYTMESSREYLLKTVQEGKTVAFEKVFDICKEIYSSKIK